MKKRAMALIGSLLLLTPQTDVCYAKTTFTLAELEAIKHPQNYPPDIEKKFPVYPYLPHAYPLWELAPNLGKGITVTLIDTGVFGFTFSTPTHTFVKHPDYYHSLFSIALISVSAMVFLWVFF